MIPDIPAEVRFERPIDAVRLRQCLKQVEAWDGHSVGRHGERGSLQMKPALYLLYDVKQITYCVKLLEACQLLGRPRSIYLAALIHNAGFDSVRLNRTSENQRDFALRVANVYDTIP